MRDRGAGLRESLVGGVLLTALALLFWKLRIIDTAYSWFSAANLDMIIGQQPMTMYAVEALKAGRLPLWNPYQLCGQPFLAVSYVGLFYPLNAIYLLAGTAVGFEISFVVHMVLGAGCMALLARELGLGRIAALTSALTFCWSGWLIHYANQPQIFAGLAWMPASVLAVERVLKRARAGELLLIGVVALQLFNGAAEVLVHSLYAAGLYAAFRLVALARGGAWSLAATRGAVLLGCVAFGGALAAVQLLPTLELVAHSVRGAGELDLQDALRRGPLPLRRMFPAIAGSAGVAHTGVLALAAAGLAFGAARHRVVWMFAVSTAVLALALAEGGAVYRLYFETPLGSLFRRPVKFLDLYSLAQALLCGLAVERLGALVCRRAGEIWRSPDWWLGLTLAAAIAIGLVWTGESNPFLFGLLALLVGFGALPRGAPRRVAFAAIVALHAVSLFVGAANRSYRPWHFPTFLDDHSQRIEVERLRDVLGHQRLYISPQIHLSKQGLVSHLAVVNDYEPLSLRRYADYFTRAAADRSPRNAFTGRYRVGPETRWSLMDAAGAKLYLFPGSGAPHARRRWIPEGPGFRRLQAPIFQLIERESPLPRAYFAARGRVVGESAAVLAAMADPDFDPRMEVLLEGDSALAASPAPTSALIAAEIEVYEPERVEVVVDAPGPGFLVLTDLHFPGWTASIDGRPAALLRANYLFRAVPVEAGRSRVRFDYAPTSFRVGLAVTALCAFGLVAHTLRSRWTRD